MTDLEQLKARIDAMPEGRKREEMKALLAAMLEEQKP